MMLSKTLFSLAAAAVSCAGVCIVIWLKRIFLWLMGLVFLLLIGVSLLGFTHQGNKWLWQQAQGSAAFSQGGAGGRSAWLWLDSGRGGLAG